MDTTMIQLRLFVHQRLFSAAEKILGEVEKTIALALQEAGGSRSKETEESLRHQLDQLIEQPAATLPVTTSNMEHEEECGIQPMQENIVPSSPEESPEVPGPSNPSTDLDDTDRNQCLVGAEFNMPEIKEEQEQDGDESPTLEAEDFPSPEIETYEEDQPEISYKIQPEPSDCSVKDRKDREYCPFCNKDFAQMGGLVQHANAHRQENKCKSCGKTYKSTYKLIKHFKSCCRKDLFCDICGKLFSNIASVRRHKKIHGVGRFPCHICGKRFHQIGHYTSHVRTHHEKPPYHCDICGQAFGKSHHLTIHKRTHSEEKPYQCGLCGKRFILNVHLKAHMIVHRVERGIQLQQENLVPLTLEEIPEVAGPSNPSTDLDDTDRNDRSVWTEFNAPEIRGEHEQAGNEGPTPEADFPFPEIGTYEQDQPEISYKIQPAKASQKDRYYCPFCNKMFSQMSALMGHAKSHKEQNNCKSCGKTYKSTYNLVKHFKNCCSKDLFCDVCGKLFPNVANVKVHKRIHRVGKFPCQICGKRFHQISQYITHVRTHSGKPPYHCDICGQAFGQSQSLTIHKRTHSERKPYKCGLCDKRCTSISHLEVHMIVHREECGIQLPQENQEESPEVPGPSNPSTDLDDTDQNRWLVGAEFNMPEIKEEQEQAGDEGPTLEAVFPFPEIGKFEQDQPEISYEMLPEFSDYSADQTAMQKTKTVKAALPHRTLSCRSLKVQNFCPFCNKEFLYMGALVTHVDNHRQENKCKICDKRFMTIQKLIKHFKICRKKRPVTNTDLQTTQILSGKGQEECFCPFCGKGFFYVRVLMKHVQSHKRPNDCHFCGMTHGSIKQLLKHLRSCHRKSLFCGLCGYAYVNSRPLCDHTQKSVKKISCKQCGKTLPHRYALNVHMMSHGSKKPHPCDVCGKPFVSSSALKTHRVIHSEERPYPCDICGKHFRRKEMLTRHRTIHTHTKPNCCHICGVRFKSEFNLNLHLESHGIPAPEPNFDILFQNMSSN